MTQTYKAPDVPNDKVTPEFVRDELLRCFESANKEFMAILNQPVTDEQLKQQVRQFVESVFVNCGASFTEPTKDGILTGMGQCRSNAEKMMGPRRAGMIQHHYDEMMKLVDRLQERPAYVATSRLV